MVLVAFLRGVNVGGHRTFKPSILARDLSEYGVVNVGAAGTFVVRRPRSQAAFRAALREYLPFETRILLCAARDVLSLVRDTPFGEDLPRPNITRFVSILSNAGAAPHEMPLALPSKEEWFVRLIGSRGRFVFGEYRRHMKTIGYLGKIDRLFGASATTRTWNTILSLARILQEEG